MSTGDPIDSARLDVGREVPLTTGDRAQTAGRSVRPPHGNPVRRMVLKWLILFATAALIWLCGLPLSADVIAGLTLAIIALRARPTQMACLLISLIVAMGLAEGAARVMIGGRVKTQLCERDADKYTRNIRFEPNLDDVLSRTHGDLASMDPSIADAIIEPRSERFRTDALGYRNDSDYHGQSIILSGDSFIVGNGTDQRDTLPNVLRDEHGIDTYSIAFPNDPSHYFIRCADFVPKAGRHVSILMFIFEGNDFVTPPRPLSEPSRYDLAKMRVIRGAPAGMVLPEYVFNASHRIERLLLSQGHELVEVHSIGGRSVGFFGNYVDAALQERMELKPIQGGPDLVDPKVVAPHIRGVFYIPTKYRVYSEHISRPGGATPIWPAPGYITTTEYFSQFGVPVVDLTPLLKERARELLAQGRYVFWRDDTHWNGEGIRVAAKAVAQFLQTTAGG